MFVDFQILAALQEAVKTLKEIEKKMTTNTQALLDLQNVVAKGLSDINAVAQAIQTAVTDIAAAVTKLGQQVAAGVDPAAVEQEVSNISGGLTTLETATSSLTQATASLEAALNPPTPPPAA